MTRTFALLGVAAIALSVSCGGVVRRPDGGEGLLPVGARAPEVVGQDVAGHETRLTALRGTPAVVYFYPRDGTPGCTAEACAFRDAWSRYQTLHVTVLGVSTDSVERHRAFQADHALPFPLTSDEDGTVGDAYGVPRRVFGYSRVTFLIGRDGAIAKVWPSVDPGVNASEVIAAIAALP